MGSNNKFDFESKEGKKKLGFIIVAIVIFIEIVASAGILLIPFIIFGLIGLGIYKNYKKNQNIDANGFDYSKSYSERKDVDSGLLESQRLEQEYLKGRNYSSSKVNENNLYFDRKTTNFDKHHAHENMYPTKQKEIKKKEKVIPLSKEEQLTKYQNDLKQLKTQYNNYQIGIIEYREQETILKEKINTLKKDILEN